MTISISLPRSRAAILITIGVVVLVIAAAAALYFFTRYNNLKSNPEVLSEATTKRLVEKVGKLYALPTDEEPTVAHVEDKEKLKDQAYFAKAQNGDHILIYTKAKVAILYREKDNKIINVGPIDVNSANPETSKPETSP